MRAATGAWRISAWSRLLSFSTARTLRRRRIACSRMRQRISSSIPTRRVFARLVSPPDGASRGRESDLSLRHAERSHILLVLTRTKGRVEGPKGAAKLLGLAPSTLRHRMRRLNIDRHTSNTGTNAIVDPLASCASTLLSSNDQRFEVLRASKHSE